MVIHHQAGCVEIIACDYHMDLRQLSIDWPQAGQLSDAADPAWPRQLFARCVPLQATLTASADGHAVHSTSGWSKSAGEATRSQLIPGTATNNGTALALHAWSSMQVKQQFPVGCSK